MWNAVVGHARTLKASFARKWCRYTEVCAQWQPSVEIGFPGAESACYDAKEQLRLIWRPEQTTMTT
jgi:hypothetical protein